MLIYVLYSLARFKENVDNSVSLYLLDGFDRLTWLQSLLPSWLLFAALNDLKKPSTK